METTSNNFKEFENGIENSFIGPKIIDKKDWISSFNNMVNTTPDLKKMNFSNNIYKIESEKDNSSDTNSNTQKIKYEKKCREIIFGEHRGISFFETYAREIIFQLFSYPLMSYRKYELIIEKINEQGNNNIKNKNENKEDNSKNNKSDAEISNTKKQTIIYNIKKNLRANNLNNEIIYETSTNKKEKDKQKDKNKQDDKSETNDLTKGFSSDINLNKAKKLMKKLNKQKKKIFRKIRMSPNKNCSMLNEFKKEIVPKINEHSDYDITKNKNIEKEIIKGDFDFLIHSLDNNKLKNVLENEEISPFIFYGNFELKNNEVNDIIGEIKETQEPNDTLIKQAEKYISLINNLARKRELNDKLGFKIKNRKILMYVFNGKYHRFIENILDFQVNKDKFKNMKNYKNFESYNNIVDSFSKLQNKQKNGLLNFIITSGIPFIFIFIQNLIKLKELKDNNNDNIVISLKKEVEELDKKIKAFNKEKLDLNQKIEDLTIKNVNLMNDNENLNKKIAILEKANFNQAIENLKQENSFLKNENKRLEGMINKQNDEIANLKSVIETRLGIKL